MKLANAMINSTDEAEVNEEAHPPSVVSEFEIAELHTMYHPIRQQPMQRHCKNHPMQRCYHN